MPDSTMFYGYFDSSVGALLLAGDGRRLHLLGFPRGSRAKTPAPGWRRDDARFAEACQQLSEYFLGARSSFELPLHFAGTDFQNTVWHALCDIPFGTTTTYGTLAERIGRPSASRAVGAANGANPLPIIVPCHRVISADASLTGFGGGIEMKRFLLDPERAAAARSGR